MGMRYEPYGSNVKVYVKKDVISYEMKNLVGFCMDPCLFGMLSICTVFSFGELTVSMVWCYIAPKA